MRRGGAAFLCLASALAVLALLLLAGPAAAQIVYVHDGDVWVMNDDGGGARPLVDDTPLGMSSLSDPHPSLDGATIYFSGSTSLYYSTDPSSGYVASGFWATGAYRWTAAGPVRLSPPPAFCTYCSTFDTDVAPTAAGSFAEVESFYGESDSDARIAAGDPASVVPTACKPYSAAPDPVNASLYAYVCDEGEPAVKISSGDPGSETTARTTSGVGYSYGLSIPIWRSDGARLALAENSAIAEGTLRSRIATFNPDGSDPRILVASADPKIRFDSPTFIGGDRVAFTAITEVEDAEDPTDVWTVPASCVECAFPAAATQITHDGLSRDPSYTPGTVPLPTAAPAAPAPSPPSSAPAPAPSSPPRPGTKGSPLLGARALTKKAAPKRGFALQLKLADAATVKFDIAKLVKKKPKPIGSLSRALKAGTSTVTFTKVGKKRLTKGRYRVGVKVPGEGSSLDLTVTAR